MSVSYIPEKTKQALFGLAAGRCQYRGCNKLLTEEHLTRRRGKFSVFAHIIADEPGGPRGHPVLSKQLAKELSNLMLLCLDHHRLIDVDAVEAHPPELLRGFKAHHERRIRRLSGIQGERRTLVVTMSANIGARKGVVGGDVLEAVLPCYPVEETVEIELARLRVRDGRPAAWAVGVEEINERAAQVQDTLARLGLDHLSVFALGPQPLLMTLGVALGDVAAVVPHQRRRSPPGWGWLPSRGDEPAYCVDTHCGTEETAQVALAISVSGSVDVDRVRQAIGPHGAIYELRVSDPMTDVVRAQEQVLAFRAAVREVITMIRDRHGSDTTCRVFPALPNSLAVAFGQALLPKSDPRVLVHDLNAEQGGWTEALELLPGPA